jgi:TrmH family RNA methyltransferase
VITSASNPKLRYVRRLAHRAFRHREGRLVAEGVRLVADVLDTGARPAFALVSEELDATAGGAQLHSRLRSSKVALFDVAPRLLADLGDTVTSQGVLAVFPFPELPWPEEGDLGRGGLVLVMDSVRDPGNVGTMLRTALASGADGVVAAPGTVDATSPKVVRAGMGAQFRVPLRDMSWGQVAALSAAAGLQVIVADASAERSYTSVDWTKPSMLVIGGETEGVSEQARQLGEAVRIPMSGPAESLNAAVAAAVILFEAVRQRASAA